MLNIYQNIFILIILLLINAIILSGVIRIKKPESLTTNVNLEFWTSRRKTWENLSMWPWDTVEMLKRNVTRVFWADGAPAGLRNHRSHNQRTLNPLNDFSLTPNSKTRFGSTELTQRRALDESPVRTSQRVSMQITEKDL